MRILIAAVAVVLLAGCASSHVDVPKPRETQECMTYRSMMTAPMAPDATIEVRVRAFEGPVAFESYCGPNRTVPNWACTYGSSSRCRH